jgi:hypothetical protein
MVVDVVVGDEVEVVVELGMVEDVGEVVAVGSVVGVVVGNVASVEDGFDAAKAAEWLTGDDPLPALAKA